MLSSLQLIMVSHKLPRQENPNPTAAAILADPTIIQLKVDVVESPPDIGIIQVPANGTALNANGGGGTGGTGGTGGAGTTTGTSGGQ
ncbi:hypothetical protein BGX27_005481 [Mortierella sp. AM989]|nr:hypothetical protein BGX27_005481 [Mortierella sp. AM989]